MEKNSEERRRMMSEVLSDIANITCTVLAVYGCYVAWQLHRAIKRANRELDELREKLNDE